MRKLAVALLAAGSAAFAAPAHAQDFWFGIGPFGFGVGPAPYAYSYDPYWGALYAYEGPVTTEYVAPAYAYAAPVYESTYAYVPEYSYEYAPAYSYATRYPYTTPRYSYSTYAYQPEYSYRRSVTRVYEPRHHYGLRYTQASNTKYIRYHAPHHVARLTGEAYRAQASAHFTPVLHNQNASARSAYCKMAKQERNPVSWNAYYHCLTR
jgi:hypothetical protein